jgi:hypothetical protein
VVINGSADERVDERTAQERFILAGEKCSGGESFTGSAGEGGRSGLSDKAYAWFTGSGDGFSGSADGFTGSSDSGFTGSADLGWPESIDGTGVSARFSFPTDVEVDSEGNIFVVDSGSNSSVLKYHSSCLW